MPKKKNFLFILHTENEKTYQANSTKCDVSKHASSFAHGYQVPERVLISDLLNAEIYIWRSLFYISNNSLIMNLIPEHERILVVIFCFSFASSFYPHEYVHIRFCEICKIMHKMCIVLCSHLVFDMFASRILNSLQSKSREQTSFILIKFHCHCTQQSTGRFNFFSAVLSFYEF